MSVSIELPCGCRVNAAFVLSMCCAHAHELQLKQLDADAAYKVYEQKMRSSHTSTVSQEKPRG